MTQPPSSIHINEQRFKTNFAALSRIGAAGAGGAQRSALSAADMEARTLDGARVESKKVLKYQCENLPGCLCYSKTARYSKSSSYRAGIRSRAGYAYTLRSWAIGVDFFGSISLRNRAKSIACSPGTCKRCLGKTAIPNLNPSNRKTERFESPTIHE